MGNLGRNLARILEVLSAKLLVLSLISTKNLELTTQNYAQLEALAIGFSGLGARKVPRYMATALAS